MEMCPGVCIRASALCCREMGSPANCNNNKHLQPPCHHFTCCPRASIFRDKQNGWQSTGWEGCMQQDNLPQNGSWGKHFLPMEDVWGKNQPCHAAATVSTNITWTKPQGCAHQSCHKHCEKEIQDQAWTSCAANKKGDSKKLEPLCNPTTMGSLCICSLCAFALSCKGLLHSSFIHPLIAKAPIVIGIQDLGLNGCDMHVNHHKPVTHHQRGFKLWQNALEKARRKFWFRQSSVLEMLMLPFKQIKNWSADATNTVNNNIAVFTLGLKKKNCFSQDSPLCKRDVLSTQGNKGARELDSFCQEGVAAQPGSKPFWVVAREALHPKTTLSSQTKEPVPTHKQVLIPISLSNSISSHVCIAKACTSTGTSSSDPWLLFVKLAINAWHQLDDKHQSHAQDNNDHSHWCDECSCTPVWFETMSWSLHPICGANQRRFKIGAIEKKLCWEDWGFFVVFAVIPSVSLKLGWCPPHFVHTGLVLLAASVPSLVGGDCHFSVLVPKHHDLSGSSHSRSDCCRKTLQCSNQFVRTN